MIQGVVNRRFNRRFGWALALAAAAVATLALAGLTKAAVGSFSVTATPGPGQVELEWDDHGVADVAQWRISLDGVVFAEQEKDTKQTVLGLSNGQEYTFTVEAFGSETTGGRELLAMGTITATPAPAALATVVLDPDLDPDGRGNMSLSIIWTIDPADASITGIEVRWEAEDSENKREWYAVSSSEMSSQKHTISGLDNDQKYDVWARAVAGEAKGASPDKAYVDDVSPNGDEKRASAPAAPTGLTAEKGDSQITLNWATGTDAAAKSFTVEYRLSDAASWTTARTGIPVPDADADPPTHTVAGLTNGLEYLFRVKAVGSNTSYTNYDYVVETPGGLADAPTNVAAEVVNATEVKITWDPPPSVSPITGYHVERWLVGGTRVVIGDGNNAAGTSDMDYKIAATATSQTATTLKTGSPYYFRVRAVTGGGNSAWSASVFVRPSMTEAVTATPGAVTGLTAVSGDGSVTLTWDDPDNPNITDYQVRQVVSTGDRPWSPLFGYYQTTSHTVKDLTNGTSYTFQIRAVNADAINTDTKDVFEEFGPASASVTATPAPPDTVAPETTITSGPAMETLDMEATFEFESNESGATFWCSLDGETSTACTSPVTLTGLAIGSHTFEVTALDAAGNTDASPASHMWTVNMAVVGPRDDGCTIWGTEDDDILIGTPGDDVICGLGGDDVIRGGGGDDTLRGGDGDDMLVGGGGNDVLRGGMGNDRLVGKSGSDMLFGGAGYDMLRGGSGDDKLRGGSGDDVLRGGSGDDMLWGNSGDDVLRGEAGDDMLVGGKGKDTLRGGSGNNTLRGR